MISRRQFLRGQFSSRSTKSEASALQSLAQLGDNCVAFSNTVCRTCAEACEEQAIKFSPRIGGAAIPEISSERCTGCGECGWACPAAAISFIRR